MLTHETDKTAVYPTVRSDERDTTERMTRPPTGNHSTVVRAGIIVTAVSALVGAAVVMSSLIADRDESGTITSTDSDAEIRTGEPAVAETEQVGQPMSDQAEATPEDADTISPTPAESATADPSDGAETGIDTAIDTSFTGAEVPADLVPVVDKIESSIQTLEPDIGAVLVGQDVVDHLRSWGQIDPDGVSVSSCTADHCWIWLFGDSLESRVTVARDGGTMLLMTVG